MAPDYGLPSFFRIFNRDSETNDQLGSHAWREAPGPPPWGPDPVELPPISALSLSSPSYLKLLDPHEVNAMLRRPNQAANYTASAFQKRPIMEGPPPPMPMERLAAKQTLAGPAAQHPRPVDTTGADNRRAEAEDQNGDNLIALVLSMQQHYAQEVGGLQDKLEILEKHVVQMMEIFSHRLDEQAQVSARLRDNIRNKEAAGDRRRSNVQILPENAPETRYNAESMSVEPEQPRPAQADAHMNWCDSDPMEDSYPPPGNPGASMRSSGRRAPRLRTIRGGPPIAKYMRPQSLKTATAGSSGRPTRMAAKERDQHISTNTSIDDEYVQSPTLAPTLSVRPPSQGKRRASKPAARQSRGIVRKSKQPVRFSDGSFQHFIYHEHPATVQESWDTWKNGSHGQPSVESLNQSIGSYWRGDTFGRTWMRHRKLLWQKVEDDISAGMTEADAIAKWQRVCDENHITVSGLVLRIRGEHLREQKRVKGIEDGGKPARQSKKRKVTAEMDSDSGSDNEGEA